MFSLTEAGYDAIRQFTRRAPKPSVIRDELMIKVQAFDVGDAVAVRDLITERREWAEAKVQRYERLRNRILNGLSEEEFLATAPRVGPYLTLMRGISFEEENLRWAKRGAGDRRPASGRRVRQVVREHRSQPVDELCVGHGRQRRHAEDVAGHGHAE
jgi:hypothetical protein